MNREDDAIQQLMGTCHARKKVIWTVESLFCNVCVGFQNQHGSEHAQAFIFLILFYVVKIVYVNVMAIVSV